MKWQCYNQGTGKASPDTVKRPALPGAVGTFLLRRALGPILRGLVEFFPSPNMLSCFLQHWHSPVANSGHEHLHIDVCHRIIQMLILLTPI